MRNKSLSEVCDAMNVFRPWINLDIFKYTPFNRIELLLQVANNPGISMTEISKILNMSLASVSRNVSVLSVEGWSSTDNKKKTNGIGLALIFSTPDPSERRRKLLYLTEKGKKLVFDSLK